MVERTAQQLSDDVDNMVRIGTIAGQDALANASNPKLANSPIAAALGLGFVVTGFLAAALRHPEWAKGWLLATGFADLSTDEEIDDLVADLPITVTDGGL